MKRLPKLICRGRIARFLFFVWLAGGIFTGYWFRSVAGALYRLHGSTKRQSPAEVQSEISSEALIADLLEGCRREGKLSTKNGMLARNAIRGWLAADPAACLNFLDRNSANGLLADDEVVRILWSADGASVDSLAGIAKSLNNSRLADVIITAAFKRALVRSPISSMTVVAGAPRHLQPKLEREAVAKIATSLGSAGLESAFRNSRMSQDAAKTGLLIVANSDSDAAFALFDSIHEDLSKRPGYLGGERDIFWQLVEVAEPEVSLKWLAQMPSSPFVDRMIATALVRQIRSDPSNFPAVLANAPSEAIATTALSLAAEAVATSNPEISLRMIEQISSDPIRAAAYEKAGYWLGGLDPTIALTFAASVPNAIDRASAVFNLGERWLRSDPVKAWEFSVQRLTDPVFFQFVESAIQSRLAPDDLPGSAQRLASLKSLSPSAKQAFQNSIVTKLPQPQKTLLYRIMW